MKPKQKQQSDVKLICGTCGKPIADRPQSNVTRWLFQESRCTCRKPDFALVASEASTPEMQLCTTDSAADVYEAVERNLGDKYEVLSLLGRGGMGAVYKVRDRSLQQIFAVKVLKSNLVEDASSVKRFEREAQAASALTHPNLVAVYDFGVGREGAPYLVMDYVDGTSLEELIKKERFIDVPHALDIFSQVAEAASYAHVRGVIHRDIKPNNILITRAESGLDFVKLIDFGIAKVLPSEARATQNLTQTGEIFGSPLYMSPEQCQGQRLDARSDIYSIGCVMYEALAGKPPFQGDNPVQTILKHINSDPTLFSELKLSYRIAPDLERVVMHCLEKQPGDRYQTADELFRDLERLREGKPIALKGKAAGSKARTARQRRSRIVVTVSAAGTCLCLTLIVLLRLGVIQPNQLIAAVNTGGPRDPYSDAERLDQLSYQYFVTGDYERAIPLLEFGIKTYKENGKRLGYGREDTYLGDNYQHIGKCYMMLKRYQEAVPYYQKALAVYRKFGNYQGSLMAEAVRDYATVLTQLGRVGEAAAMEKAFKAKGNLSHIP